MGQQPTFFTKQPSLSRSPNYQFAKLTPVEDSFLYRPTKTGNNSGIIKILIFWDISFWFKGRYGCRHHLVRGSAIREDSERPIWQQLDIISAGIDFPETEKRNKAEIRVFIFGSAFCIGSVQTLINFRCGRFCLKPSAVAPFRISWQFLRKLCFWWDSNCGYLMSNFATTPWGAMARVVAGKVRGHRFNPST